MWIGITSRNSAAILSGVLTVHTGKLRTDLVTGVTIGESGSIYGMGKISFYSEAFRPPLVRTKPHMQ